jgi:hypothetical protein
MRRPCSIVRRVASSISPPKRVELEELHKVEAQAASQLANRKRLRPAADAGDALRLVEGRLQPGVEQLWFQVDLPVGDRNQVGRDISGKVAALGLGDRECRQRAAALLLAARSSSRA